MGERQSYKLQTTFLYLYKLRCCMKTFQFALLPCCPVALLPRCPFSFLPICPSAHLPICDFALSVLSVLSALLPFWLVSRLFFTFLHFLPFLLVLVGMLLFFPPEGSPTVYYACSSASAILCFCTFPLASHGHLRLCRLCMRLSYSRFV